MRPRGRLPLPRRGRPRAERLVSTGARVAVSTTLNVGSLDLLHPDLYRGDARTRERARRLMDCYVALGCRPTWTCAPYQLPRRPAFGEQIVWAESNAIVFANSMLGARTNRYGDFVDVSAAIVGRVPDAGLHRAENRRGRIVFRLARIPRRLLEDDVIYRVLGHLVGAEAGTHVTPILRRTDGPVMTNSAKWAYYAPRNLGVEVVFGSLEECLRSAPAGRVCRGPELWSGG